MTSSSMASYWFCLLKTTGLHDDYLQITNGLLPQPTLNGQFTHAHICSIALTPIPITLTPHGGGHLYVVAHSGSLEDIFQCHTRRLLGSYSCCTDWCMVLLPYIIKVLEWLGYHKHASFTSTIYGFPEIVVGYLCTLYWAIIYNVSNHKIHVISTAILIHQNHRHIIISIDIAFCPHFSIGKKGDYEIVSVWLSHHLSICPDICVSFHLLVTTFQML